MGLQEEGDDDLHERFEALCLDLNMDDSSRNSAWQSFQQTKQNYTLEGEPLHWLACALYVACRKMVIPTVGRGVTEGNGVSLTRLLRSSKFMLLQFFNKMKKWCDMTNMPKEFRDKVERLERNFAVSTVIFKKFEPIFLEIYRSPSAEPPRAKSRKQRRLPCTPGEVFSFCWTLFVHVKSNFPQISDDLVNSYHLLLCCVDWIYSNALAANRADLLNTDFSGLPAGFGAPDFRPPGDHCLITHLCEQHDGIVLEAKGIKEHWWRPHIKKLFERKILKGKAETLTGVLDTQSFDSNRAGIEQSYQSLVSARGQLDERLYTLYKSKAINGQYESYVLDVGDFDERIFVEHDHDGDIGMSQRSPMATSQELAERMDAKKKLSKHIDEQTSLTPVTPLTGRRYLPQEETPVTPVSTATQSVSRLHALLSGRQTSPSGALCNIYKQCKTTPADEIDERVKQMGDIFCEKYAEKSDKQSASQVDFARRRLQLGECLYYKALEQIMLAENRRLAGRPSHAADLSSLLEQDMFHRSLFACCLEIVMFAYNSQRTFPWIVDVFALDAYHFYKVIEVLIRAEDGLSRDVVKHLNLIEETILEQLAWRYDSPLWQAIEQQGGAIPSCEQVTLPQQIDRDPQQPALQRLAGPRDLRDVNRPGSVADLLSSPGGKAAEVFVASPAPGSAKRNLFGANLTVTSSDAPPSARAAAAKVVIQGHSESKVLTQVQSTQSNTQPKPAKTGSLALFFRKVYHLASVRLRDLCERLEVDVDTRAQMWTCFEHTLVNHVRLMEDRHLDQLLMCAVYVIAKVTGRDQSFQDIMKCYRLQPQSQSHVYRSVLLTSRRRRTSGESSVSSRGSSSPPVPAAEAVPTQPAADDKRRGDKLSIRSKSTLPDPRPNSQPPTPTRLAGTASSFEYEDRGDLIKFYNSVYVKKVKAFAMKFSKQSVEGDKPPLSPLPMVRAHPGSPRRVSQNHSIYVSPHKAIRSGITHAQTKMLYCFNRSPSKDLRAINSMLRQPRDRGTVSKRILCDAEPNDSPVKKQAMETQGPFMRRINEVMSDRKDASADI